MCAIYNKDGQNSKRMLENVKEYILSNPFLKFFHNFWFDSRNLKQIFRDESEIDFPILIISNFFEKKFYYA